MARVTRDKKCRLCRREGVKLFLKGARCLSPKCPIERKGAVPPGVRGTRMRSRRLSEYGRQLREKQKAKRLYGVSEKMFRRYLEQAKKEKQSTREALMQTLESRLDNIVYRLGLAPSRSVARQLVSHGAILVDGKKVNVPSYLTREGEVVALLPKAAKNPIVEQVLKSDEVVIPSWLEKKGPAGKIKRLPKREEIEASVDEGLIIDFYSR